MSKNVAVIGAGISGLTALKKLRDKAIAATVFEQSAGIGGLWNLGNGEAGTAAYRSLHIISSRKVTELADFPMPKGTPQFPHRSVILRYFEQYADRFELRPHVRFNTKVERAVPLPDGKWELLLESGERAVFDALVVANGHHWAPHWPEPAMPGAFNGTQLHSHSYVDAAPFAGKRVVVVGMGNSAMDIAVEIGGVARATFLSARRGVHIVPRQVFGLPTDELKAPVIKRLLAELGLKVDPQVEDDPGALFAALLRVVHGPVERLGLPRPEHPFYASHPTISDTIIGSVMRGAVQPKPGIQALEGDRVKFVDGTTEEIDAIIYCTGYDIRFPFLDKSVIHVDENRLSLFLNVFPPDINNLAFVGFAQPVGSIFPVAELQSAMVAEWLSGEVVLPSEAEMRAAIERGLLLMHKRFYASRRHTIQIDQETYFQVVARERELGRKRVRAS